jgi:prepilin-type N-terminal cleavage/methylation domain-containing protein
MNTTKSRKGFTLIELVVTIVLLGALAAIASVSYSAFLSDARGEIAVIEEAQGARIGLAQQLLDQEGQYQAPATPSFGVLSGSVAPFTGSGTNTVDSFVLDWPNRTMTAVLSNTLPNTVYDETTWTGLEAALSGYTRLTIHGGDLTINDWSNRGAVYLLSLTDNGDGTVTMVWDLTGAALFNGTPLTDPTAVHFSIDHLSSQFTPRYAFA